VKYEKAEGEGKMLLKTTNTMKGFVQRIDPHFRKHSFALWGVYGDEGNLEIQGVWLWRGTEIPFEFVYKIFLW
jgi:elongation factor 1-gamma